jgi:hypothetical protein
VDKDRLGNLHRVPGTHRQNDQQAEERRRAEQQKALNYVMP